MQMAWVYFCKCVMNILFLKGTENMDVHVVTSFAEVRAKQCRTCLETV